MAISSKIHNQAGLRHLAIFDVLAAEKPFLAAVLTGDLQATPPTMTAISNECFARLTATSKNNTAHLVEVRSPKRAAQRVADVAAKVSRHDTVAFVCLNGATYDAVFKALNISG